MTKARDLAGFASSAVTTTAADGLVLKGDGSTTDVIIKNGANATVAKIADGSTDLSKVLARGAIDVGNSSGVSAPLSKGAAGTVLTAGANDLSWVAASAGGEQTFTATGAISAGNPVGFNANMTISAMTQQVGASAAIGTGIVTTAVQSASPISYDTGVNKFLIVFKGTGNTVWARVGTVSGTSVSFGTAVNSGHELAGNGASLFVVYCSGLSKHVVSFKSTSNRGYASTVTISGTTPSFGTRVETFASTTHDAAVVYDPNTNKVLFANQGNLSAATYRVGTISGTNISVGTQLDPGGAGISASSLTSFAFDSNSNKIVAIHRNTTTGYTRVLTISGTNVSSGTNVTFGTISKGNAFVIFDPSINKVAYFYWVGSPAKPYFRLGTVSGTNISLGTPTEFALPVNFRPPPGDEIQYSFQGTVDPDTGGLVLAYLTGPDGVIGSGAIPVKFNGANLIVGEQVVVNNNTQKLGLVYDPDTDKVIFATRSSVQTVATTIRPKFVGVAAENIANGATGKVTIIGGINSNQSSLVVGSQYGIPATSASLVATDSNPVGIAISASKIYIRAVQL